MNSPAGVFPNGARPTSDRIERRSDREERKRGNVKNSRKVSKTKEAHGNEGVRAWSEKRKAGRQ